eukprot:3846133-Rhodomonas_salina.3
MGYKAAINLAVKPIRNQLQIALLFHRFCTTDAVFSLLLAMCYALDGTDLAYATLPAYEPDTRWLIHSVEIPLSAYALATQCPVRTYRMVLCALDVPYEHKRTVLLILRTR